jgi:hypothetical protein
MKVIKIILGTLAALFAIAHIIGLILSLANGSIDLGSSYAAGNIGGRAFGICIGAAIAIACFRTKKSA